MHGHSRLQPRINGLLSAPDLDDVADTQQPLLTRLLLQVFGGAAQEFGSLKPSWESYGWSLFRPPMPPSDTPLPNGFNITRIQVCLHVSAVACTVHAVVVVNWPCALGV